ncbi:hypothetical protein [Puerhibacterium puerhi]|uniref:hypothetical protein n=1 Tax=Puerhibacterium puerhi TaxID=2692623 RepID=UPI0013589941|nr:hypothetical protein [Puerhibacterium puerhi]
MPKITLYSITGLPLDAGVAAELDAVAASIRSHDEHLEGAGGCDVDHEPEFRAAVDKVLRYYGYEVAPEYTEDSWGNMRDGENGQRLLDVYAARQLDTALAYLGIPDGTEVDSWQVDAPAAPELHDLRDVAAEFGVDLDEPEPSGEPVPAAAADTAGLPPVPGPSDFLYTLRNTAGRAADELRPAIEKAQAVLAWLDRVAEDAEDAARLVGASDLEPSARALIPERSGLVYADPTREA